MRLATVERSVRVAGGVGFGLAIATILRGIRRSSRHRVGREAGQIPDILHKRGFYLPASIVGFGAMTALWRPLPLKLPQAAGTACTFAGAAMYFAGLGLFYWGRRTMGEMYDVSSALGARLYADHRLVTHGPFRYVRHPLYVAGTLAEVGALLMYRTWASLLVVANAISLAKRARLEEEALAAEFGAEYVAYKERTPGWFPRLRSTVA